jgi:hypothetical protein
MMRIIAAVLCGVLLAFGVLWVDDLAVASPVKEVAPQAFVAKTVAEAAASVPFKAKRPDWVPFKAREEWAHSLTIGKKQALEVNQVGEGSWVSLTQVEAKLVPISDKYELKDVELPTGTVAKMMDNGRAKILIWTEGGISYQLAVSPNIEQQDLVKIATSLRPLTN